MELQVTEYSVWEAELEVTEYSRCGISLVPNAMVRKTWERRAKGCRPLGQSHLGGVIIYWRWHIWDLFLFSPLLSSGNKQIQ